MERLTERNEGDTGYFYPACFKKCGGMGSTSECDFCWVHMQICEKLGRYEDIGLTPEQIMEIDRMYRELAEKLAERSETNADRIRSMTDDELADAFMQCSNISMSKNDWLRWLQEESEE